MADGTTMSPDEYFQSGNGDDLRQDESNGQDDTPTDDTSDYDQQASGVDIATIRQQLAPIPGGGWLLEQPSATRIFKRIDANVLQQEPLAKNRDEQEKHWSYILAGSQFSVLDKSEDLSFYQQSFPPGIEEAALPIPNKVADLARKIVAQILVDPFLPLPKPRDSDTERNRAAADLMKKWLRQNGAPTANNDDAMVLECLDLNMVGKSSFAWVRTDKMGGGWRPMRKYAHPRATDATNPLYAPALDPTTGQPITRGDGSTMMIKASETESVLRYIKQGGTEFTTSPAAAERQWMPRVGRTVLRASQVRTSPPDRMAQDADDITILAYDTWGKAKQWFPVLQTLNKAQAKAACEWRPRRWKALVPEAMRKRGGTLEIHDGELSDNTLFFWYHHYCRHGVEYMDGADIAVNGSKSGKLLLKRDTLREDVTLPDGTTVPVLLSPPVSQFKGYNDVKGGDAMGRAPIEDFGGANETYAHLYMAVLDVIHKGLNLLSFIPSTSPVTREDMLRRDGRPIEILVPEDKPTYETAPSIPTFTPQIIDKVEMGMNSAAGTNETSNGLDSSYSESGIAKDVSIRQAKVALAQLWKNTRNGLVWYWTIEAQQAQAFLTVPDELTTSGGDASYQARFFTGADLVGDMDMVHQPGSGTMMAPAEKLQWLSTMQGGEWIDKDQAGEIARTSMADDLGIEPDAHEQFAARQIGDWLEGPPPGWDDAYTRNQQLTQQHQTAIQQRVAVLTQTGLDPASAQQQASQAIPAPQLTPLYTPFAPRPNDKEPGVAKTRVRKLSLVQSSNEYERFSDGWREQLDTAYNQAFYNAGGQTVEQQAQAQQQQPLLQQAAKFLQTVQQDTIIVVEKAIAKTAAAALGAPAAQPGGTAPSQPTGADPQQLAADAAAQSQTIAADRAAQSEKLAADSADAERQRQHEAQQNAADRDAKLHETVFKSILDHHNALQLEKAKQRVASAQASIRRRPARVA